MQTNDFLAIERSKLANERTFLAYFRTFIVFLSSGIAILKLDILQDILPLGYILIIISPAILLIGIVRYFIVLRKFKQLIKKLTPKS